MQETTTEEIMKQYEGNAEETVQDPDYVEGE